MSATDGINPEDRLFLNDLFGVALSDQIPLQMQRSASSHPNWTNGPQMGLYGVFWDVHETNHVPRGPATELNARRWGFPLNSQLNPPISRSRTGFPPLTGPFFQKDGDFTPHPFGVNLRADLGLQGQKVVVATPLFMFWDIILEPTKGIGAWPRGILKDEVVLEPHFLQKRPRGFVIVFRFSTKAHDDVTSQNHIREDFSSSGGEIQEGLAVVSPVHPRQYLVGATLSGSVEISTQPWMLRDRVKDVVPKIPGITGHKPNPLHPGTGLMDHDQ